jgi:hypothetical protein
MNDTPKPVYAHSVRLDPRAPATAMSVPVNPNPMRAWLIIPQDSLTQTLEPLCAQRHLPRHQFLAAMEATLIGASTPFPGEVPFVALRMTATPDGCPHALGLNDSLDWTVAETVAETLHLAALDEIPPSVIQESLSRNLPALINALKLSARTLVEDTVREAVIETLLTSRPTPGPLEMDAELAEAGNKETQP